jgi:5S rRNA maturation endonuclease (ribonuclease M5)
MMSTHFDEIRGRDGVVAAIHKRRDLLDGSKRISWLQPDGQAGLDGVRAAELPLFGSHLLDTWPVTDPVVVTEGEKAAAALQRLGIAAVGTVTGASGTPSKAVLNDLAGRIVLLWPDSDEAGRKHMRQIAETLDDIAVVAWIEWDEAPDKGDAADFVVDRTAADVRALLASATATPAGSSGERSELSERSDAGPDLSSLSSLISLQSWPDILAAEAFHGLAGEFVRTVEPYTEADPAAILASLLVTVGAMAGPEVHALAGDAEHPARLYVLITGDTSKGRKGTSGAPIHTVADLVDPDFETAGGLSSGEGLIYHVRDPIEKMVQVGRGKDRHPELQVVDPGVEDKRLLVRESEFASVLRVLQRDGNSLSAVMRTAWEAQELRTLTKNSPLRATGAHVAVLGHVSREELLRYLDRTDLANGFANRFIIVAAKRQRLLPNGGNVPYELLQGFAERLRDVVAWAQQPRLIVRDEAAERMWTEVYEKLSEGRSGLLGAATNRAEAQTLRLQVLYALLDRSPVIGEEHLLAALAVWKYADASAKWVFGDALGDTIADAILETLRLRKEMTRTEISDLFGRHTPRSRIELALNLLLSDGRITRSLEKTTGRPRELYRV